jgi:hypothetical protein
LEFKYDFEEVQSIDVLYAVNEKNNRFVFEKQAVIFCAF